MRDINRIYPYTTRLAEVWRKVPDWRLSQLLVNYCRYIGTDPFYMEDEEFISGLEKFISGDE